MKFNFDDIMQKEFIGLLGMMIISIFIISIIGACSVNNPDDYSALEQRIKLLEDAMDWHNEHALWDETNSWKCRDTLNTKIDTLAINLYYQIYLRDFQITCLERELDDLSQFTIQKVNALRDSISALQRPETHDSGYISLTSIDSTDIRLYQYTIFDNLTVGSVRIDWDANNQEPDLAGYVVWVQNGEKLIKIPISKDSTSYKIPDLYTHVEYQIYLTAYDYSNNMSAQSNTIKVKVDEPKIIINVETNTIEVDRLKSLFKLQPIPGSRLESSVMGRTCQLYPNAITPFDSTAYLRARHQK